MSHMRENILMPAVNETRMVMSAADPGAANGALPPVGAMVTAARGAAAASSRAARDAQRLPRDLAERGAQIAREMMAKKPRGANRRLRRDAVKILEKVGARGLFARASARCSCTACRQFFPRHVLCTVFLSPSLHPSRPCPFLSPFRPSGPLPTSTGLSKGTTSGPS